MTQHFIEQPRYPGQHQDRRLCVPALLLVCLCSYDRMKRFYCFVTLLALTPPAASAARLRRAGRGDRW
jgi:hypothetical protein